MFSRSAPPASPLRARVAKRRRLEKTPSTSTMSDNPRSPRGGAQTRPASERTPSSFEVPSRLRTTSPDLPAGAAAARASGGGALPFASGGELPDDPPVPFAAAPEVDAAPTTVGGARGRPRRVLSRWVKKGSLVAPNAPARRDSLGSDGVSHHPVPVPPPPPSRRRGEGAAERRDRRSAPSRRRLPLRRVRDGRLFFRGPLRRPRGHRRPGLSARPRRVRGSLRSGKGGDARRHPVGAGGQKAVPLPQPPGDRMRALLSLRGGWSSNERRHQRTPVRLCQGRGEDACETEGGLLALPVAGDRVRNGGTRRRVHRHSRRGTLGRRAGRDGRTFRRGGKLERGVASLRRFRALAVRRRKRRGHRGRGTKETRERIPGRR